ncbi:MAG: LysR family transcriptional regulator [Oscillospiraceae bacterium]
MIDVRIQTFLALCEDKSYTKTAQRLFITQPTVTQHIQYLEKRFCKKLFCYRGKSLVLTEDGVAFRNFCLSLNANIQSFENQFSTADTQRQRVSMGATKTIGDFFLPPIAEKFLTRHADFQLNIQVENTHMLFEMLERAEISFALIEGFFDKSLYHWKRIKGEEFICVCSCRDSLSDGVSFEEILSRPLFLREAGSGTRDIAGNIIKEHGFSAHNFKSVNELGSFALIKPMVIELCGISFGYRQAFERELALGALKQLTFGQAPKYRDFNIVGLKNQLCNPYFDEFYDLCTM